jgi:thiosulfate/3-mercaptopyruvate sulfurtransferase
MSMLLALALGAQIASGYARPELLVDTAWLAAHLSDPSIRIVDMRRTGYAEGHIPGAVLLDNDAIRTANRPPTFLPAEDELAALMGRLGISNATRVIVYDDRGGIYAARLWFVLNHIGHANVALLDGGWTKWADEKRQVSTTPPTIAPATFTVRPGTVKIATADTVKAAIGKPGTTIIDARTGSEIQGKELRGIKRGGYIESSVPVYWEDTLDSRLRTFKPAADIEKLYRDRGVSSSAEVITYCQIGMRAAHDLFTLALIGHDLTKLHNYYGSWEEWGNRDDTPIKK